MVLQRRNRAWSVEKWYETGVKFGWNFSTCLNIKGITFISLSSRYFLSFFKEKQQTKAMMEHWESWRSQNSICAACCVIARALVNHSNIYFNINVLMSHLKGWDQAFTLSATHFINFKALSVYIKFIFYIFIYFIMIFFQYKCLYSTEIKRTSVHTVNI